ncbi:MAG: hypothetical protein HYT88_02870 [Candidatus Omnitrophica bacterium]|nr:hypothetical protein [Candidatus Omnitrophota bacterium]
MENYFHLVLSERFSIWDVLVGNPQSEGYLAWQEHSTGRTLQRLLGVKKEFEPIYQFLADPEIVESPRPEGKMPVPKVTVTLGTGIRDWPARVSRFLRHRLPQILIAAVVGVFIPSAAEASWRTASMALETIGWLSGWGVWVGAVALCHISFGGLVGHPSGRFIFEARKAASALDLQRNSWNVVRARTCVVRAWCYLFGLGCPGWSPIGCGSHDRFLRQPHRTL